MADIVDVKELLINTITTERKLPILLQGSMSSDTAYPDSFYTFWNNDSSDSGFYDNNETVTIWDFDLNFYSNDPTTVNTELLEAKRALKAVGFIVNGAGYDVISDEVSHTGRGINLIYIQKVR